MSDFGEALFDLLPVHSALQNPNNPGRKVLDNSIGEWFDHQDILEFYDNLFLDTATGAYLDLFGKDYGVGRRLNESDEDYRIRIIQEKNDRLTPSYLESVYGLTLYVYIAGFNAANNTLTSDNQYINDKGYMCESTGGIVEILSSKFLIDNNIYWLFDGSIDYILNGSNVNIITDYMMVYSGADKTNFFKGQTGFMKVNLNLNNVENATYLFRDCTGLTDVILMLPNARSPSGVLMNCTGLVNVTLSIPRVLGDYSSTILPSSLEGLEYLNLTVRDNYKSSYISKFSNLTNYPSLETLIVNGEEVDLS